ncbi:MAG: conjugal transfer protein TraH [Aquabacterium sp.]
MTGFAKKTTASAACITLMMATPMAVAPAHADIKSAMTDMFNSSSVMSSGSLPNVYQTQSSNVLVGGSMQMRMPVKNYQFFTFEQPTVKAGCGGVDLRLGSFSWINEEKFKEMLQAIGNNSVGLLYQAALSVISPLIGGKLEGLLKTLQDASEYMANSCQAAEMLVDGALGRKNADLYSACMKIQTLKGKDQVEAKAACKDHAPEENEKGKKDSDPAIRAMAQKDINLVWDALSKTKLTHDQKELYMNITGSIIIRAKKADGAGADTDRPVDAVIDTLQILETGSTGSVGPVKPGDVTIKGWHQCDKVADPDCLNPTEVDKSFTPFSYQAFNHMMNLLNNLQSNSSPKSGDIQFVNMSSLPVVSMLKIGYMSRTDSLALSLANRYSRVIGYDFAYNFLERGLKDARSYLSNGANRRGIESEKVDTLLGRMDNMLMKLNAERQFRATDEVSMNQMISNIVETEKQMYANLPHGLQNMLMFTNQMSSIRMR